MRATSRPWAHRMADLRDRLGLKRGALVAGMRMTLPVRGFRPLRSWRRVTMKVPKPPMVTRRPFFSESKTQSTKAFRARSEETFEPAEALAMTATRSALVTGHFYSTRLGQVK